MAENSSDPAGPLDVQRIHYLVRLMSDITRPTALDVSDGSVQVRLRRRFARERSLPAAGEHAGEPAFPNVASTSAAARAQTSRRRRARPRRRRS